MEHTKTTLQEYDMLLQLLQKKGQTFWEVDIARKKFRFWQSPDHIYNVWQDFPSFLIDHGFASPNFIVPFQQYAQQILDGKEPLGRTTLLLKSQENHLFLWCALSYRLICDPDTHTPLRAIGVMQSLSSPGDRHAQGGSNGHVATDLTDLECFATPSTMNEAIETLLRMLGEYYRADRVYLLCLTGTNKVLTSNEWCSPLKKSLRLNFLDRSINNIPTIRRCVRDGKPVHLEKKQLFDQNRHWRFAAYPVSSSSSGHADNVLCIENAQENTEDLVYVTNLIFHLENILNRRSLQYQDSVSINTLTSLPNLVSFTRKVGSYTPDTCRSLGVFVLRVMDFAAFSANIALDRLLDFFNFVAQTLGGIFYGADLYQILDSEFIVLAPNTDNSTFNTLVFKVKLSLDKAYPGRFLYSHTWSDNFLSGKYLVDEARRFLVSNIPHVSQDDHKDFAFNSSLSQKLVHDPQYHFLIYLQPKINMRTGRAYAAEALVRGRDENGNIIPPSVFIDDMERMGLLRELDFHVLRSVLRLLDKWRIDHKNLIPISVNFSRFTLFAPTSPASVLALLSQYPDIPPELIEIEITETASSIASKTIADTMALYRSSGVHFALDDFGSAYANLSLFANVTFDTIKLDRSLIKDIARNDISLHMVKNIATICSQNRIHCIAEGVETGDQEKILLENGCTFAQGFYYDRPLPVEDFEYKYITSAGTSQPGCAATP